MLPVIVVHSGVATSEGFASFNGSELGVPFSDQRLGQYAAALCEQLVNYALREQRRIVDGEKISWATGVLRVELIEGTLRCSALDIELDDFSPFADSLIRQWLAQGEVCRLAGSSVEPARLDQYVVVSPGVLNSGDLVAFGARYRYNEPNSGWWLYGSAYDGDVSKMLRVHVGDVLRYDSSIGRFFALEPGMVFQREPMKVARDSEIAAAEPI